MKEDITYPIRINRYLYKMGHCSRRQADTFIERGLVKVNGIVAVIGQKVEKGDTVTLEKEIKNLKKHFTYYLFNKPVGIVSHNPQREKGEQSVEDIFKTKEAIFPIGRLDKDSEGLMLLTSDRRIVNSILNPDFAHEKEYIVTVDKDLKENVMTAFARGINIEGYVTKPSQAKIIGKRLLKIILTEGKKHQIRRMLAALGYQVKKLKRTRIMHLELGNLSVGEGRELANTEKNTLLKHIGI